MISQQGKVLVFIHVPKTAGTTLMRRILNLNEPGDRNHAIGNVFKGGGGTSTVLLRQLREDRGPNLGGVRLVTGHFPLGVREYLPRCFPRDRNFRYFTFLREPIDRTLSHYFQVRELPEGSYQLPPLPEDASLDDALEGGYLHDNLHTRMLSGLAEPFDEVTDEMLEQAKDNLREELVYFGLTERFDESLVLAKRRLGLGSILYESNGRVNTSRPRGKDVPKELNDAARRANRYDIELYRYAQELFDSAPERAELDFQVELAAFDAAMVDGEIELKAPPPASFGGDEQAWRMLLHARAALLREERDFGVYRLRRLTSGSDSSDAGKSEAEAVTAKVKELEQELEAARVRTKELERDVRRLEAARSRQQRDPKRTTARSARSTRSRSTKRATQKGGGASSAKARASVAPAKKRRSRAAGTGSRRAKASRPRPDDDSGGKAEGDRG